MTDLLDIKRLKKGKYFGAISGRGNWLYCSIESIKKGVIEAYVMNGCWNLKYDLKTLKSLEPYEGSTIVYNKKVKVPKDEPYSGDPCHAHYNKAIYIMDEEYNKSQGK